MSARHLLICVLFGLSPVALMAGLLFAVADFPHDIVLAPVMMMCVLLLFLLVEGLAAQSHTPKHLGIWALFLAPTAALASIELPVSLVALLFYKNWIGIPLGLVAYGCLRTLINYADSRRRTAADATNTYHLDMDFSTMRAIIGLLSLPIVLDSAPHTDKADLIILATIFAIWLSFSIARRLGPVIQIEDDILHWRDWLWRWNTLPLRGVTEVTADKSAVFITFGAQGFLRLPADFGGNPELMRKLRSFAGKADGRSSSTL